MLDNAILKDVAEDLGMDLSTLVRWISRNRIARWGLRQPLARRTPSPS